MFTYITSVVKPVHFFMARNRVSKSRLKAELCFHRYVHFACVPIYIFYFLFYIYILSLYIFYSIYIFGHKNRSCTVIDGAKRKEYPSFLLIAQIFFKLVSVDAELNSALEIENYFC